MALKTFNPVPPSQRQLVIVDRSELWKGKPVKALTEGLKQKGGRNNTGRTTMRWRGGGHKRRYRIIDFKRAEEGQAGQGADRRPQAKGRAQQHRAYDDALARRRPQTALPHHRLQARGGRASRSRR